MRRFQEAADLAKENGIDGKTLISLTAKEIETDLKINRLKARRLMKEIGMENYWKFD